MTTAVTTVVASLVLDGLATDADLAQLDVPVLSTRLVLPTEEGAACGCHLSEAEHRPLVIVGVGPHDPVHEVTGRAPEGSTVLVDEGHRYLVGSQIAAPGVSARVVGAVPFAAPTLLTTLLDVTRIALASRHSAARVVTHAVVDTTGDLPDVIGLWKRTDDPLTLRKKIT